MKYVLLRKIRQEGENESVGNGFVPLIRTDKLAFNQRSEGGRAVEKSGRRVFQEGEGASAEALRRGCVPGHVSVTSSHYIWGEKGAW